MAGKWALIAGAGPGVSGSFARRLAREGYNVALLGSDADAIDALTVQIEEIGRSASGAVVDLTDPPAVDREIARIGAEAGELALVHFNPSTFREADPLTLTPAQLAEDVSLGVGALLTVVQAALPFMGQGARVTVTGSMAADKPWSGAASLGVQKAGVRNLVHSLDDVLQPKGMRAVSLTVCGSLASEGPFSPDRVGDALWAAATQPEESWESEVRYSG